MGEMRSKIGETMPGSERGALGRSQGQGSQSEIPEKKRASWGDARYTANSRAAWQGGELGVGRRDWSTLECCGATRGTSAFREDVRKIGPGEDGDSPRRAATYIREDREESRNAGTHERRET